MSHESYTGRLTAGVLVEPRFLHRRQPASLCDELRRRGHEVVVIDPESIHQVGAGTWLAGIDVVVPRGSSPTLLSLVGFAEHQGVAVVNGSSALRSVYDKAGLSVALDTAGIPTPQTFAAAPRRLANTVPVDCYPLVLKPPYGDDGQRLFVVPDAEQLARVTWPEPIALAQQLVPSDGFDLKLYGAGEDVWAVRKPSRFTPLGSIRTPDPVELTDELTALARSCGELFDLELYDVDCVETEAGPVAIDVGGYPDYTGVEEADERLADLVERRAGS